MSNQKKSPATRAFSIPKNHKNQIMPLKKRDVWDVFVPDNKNGFNKHSAAALHLFVVPKINIYAVFN
jgi:hypothetical protein